MRSCRALSPGRMSDGDGEVHAGTLLEALDRIRDDYREDLREHREDLVAVEGRVMTAIAAIDRKLDDASRTHAEVHIAEATLERNAHEIYDSFIRDSKIAAARRDGALGVVRFVVELVGANWKGILAGGAALSFLLGQLRVTVGAG
jgi:hypothetical protein